MGVQRRLKHTHTQTHEKSNLLRRIRLRLDTLAGHTRSIDESYTSLYVDGKSATWAEAVALLTDWLIGAPSTALWTAANQRSREPKSGSA